jgi:hypothetical protein
MDLAFKKAKVNKAKDPYKKTALLKRTLTG